MNDSIDTCQLPRQLTKHCNTHYTLFPSAIYPNVATYRNCSAAAANLSSDKLQHLFR